MHLLVLLLWYRGRCCKHFYKGNGCCKHLNRGKDWKVEKKFHVTLAKVTKDQHLQSACNPKIFVDT
jgi:hypothetical protein